MFENLSEEKIISIFDTDGILSQHLSQYEVRHQQIEMVRQVVSAYNNSNITMIEAGTGTGKSLAYLIPAILWSLSNGQVTVIATNTINLQQQILEKDIPFIKSTLDLDFKATLVKGMNNYICLRRLKDFEDDIDEGSALEKECLTKLLCWCDRNSAGSKTDLDFIPSKTVWSKICAERESCNNMRCKYYKECYFFRARYNVYNSQILIVNHHLLFSDLIAKISNKSHKGNILPKYSRLILDEAHNVEEVATEYFGSSIDQRYTYYLLRRIFSEDGYSGRVNQLKNYIQKNCGKRRDVELIKLFNYIDYYLKSKLITLDHTLKDSFDCILKYAKNNSNKQNGDRKDFKLRIISSDRASYFWKNKIIPHINECRQNLLSFIEDIISLIRQVKSLKRSDVVNSLENVLIEIECVNAKLYQFADAFELIFIQDDSKEDVTWIEVSDHIDNCNIKIVKTKIDISTELSSQLFEPLETAILCSATMTTNNNFNFMQNRLGIKSDLIKEKQIVSEIYPSPFDYQKQILFLTLDDMPKPNESSYFNKLVENIEIILKSCRGNAFILFTSHQLMQRSYLEIEKRMDKRFNIFVQGQSSSQELLKNFVANDYSVLFGTDSFWEGVDVVGDSLRCVIIVKLPFRVPDDPVIAARTEFIDENGGNSFFEYAVPMAVTKFKQGFGRLIRHRKDRGCVVCLDSRINNKTYGRMFLRSLQNTTSEKIVSEEMMNKINMFFRYRNGA